jgi:hypothetical protein
MINFIGAIRKFQNKLKLTLFILSFFLVSYSSAQFYLTVPFNNGFVGDNSGNNSSTLAYYAVGSVGVGLD